VLVEVEVVPGYRTGLRDDGHGAPVVLLHGTPFDMRAWQPVVGAMNGSRRAIRFDARGHGSAVDVPVAHYGRLADDVVAVLDRLDLHDAHVVGHSWGGQIAQQVALDHPERVNRLSLVCTRASPFPAFTTAAQGLRDGIVDVEASLARWFTPDELAEHDGLAATVRAWLHAADRSRWADALEMISSFDALAQLSRIAVPTDVIAAEHDGVAVPQHMTQIADTVPKASFRLIAGARHLAPLQRPRQIAQIILEDRP
jgi:pimeloyl-ACP methyl ester carboxylesterase